MYYTDSLDTISANDLQGFFVGWPNRPSPERHLALLHGSAHVFLAVDEGSGQVVGFITAISDGVLAAFIPLLEVLPEYQDKGIGTELVTRMLARLSAYYSVDLLCDPELQPWYNRLGMRPGAGMMIRNYAAAKGQR